MAIYSTSAGVAPQGVSINNNRRLFNFGNRIAELSPQETLFFSYLSKLSKKPTNDPVFKFLERRHQWQRRNFEVQANFSATAISSAMTVTDLKLTVDYDKFGREVTTDTKPEFLLPGQVIAVEGTVDVTATGSPETKMVHIKITSLGASTSALQNVTGTVIAIGGESDYATTFNDHTVAFADGDDGQVVGSAFAEATGAPDGWTDAIYDREGYTQIFKTAIPIVSGTTQATVYRGIPDELMRIWAPKMKEHKMDIAHALLFGVGKSDESGSGPLRYTHGIVPYTEANGWVENFTYASTNFDAFMDFLEAFMAPERGNSSKKVVLTSRKIINWINKIGSDGFLTNSVGSSAFRLAIDNVPGQFGHNITRVFTPFGTLGFMQEVLLRGPWEDYALMIDMANIAYRPLVGNGKSRDTFVKTNVQDNDLDGRKDMILTECGLEISLPETHAILKFS